MARHTKLFSLGSALSAPTLSKNVMYSSHYGDGGSRKDSRHVGTGNHVSTGFIM